jgi:soluble lytic murein transglycosylase-like protein
MPSSSSQTAVPRGGCLTRFLLLPVAALCIGVILMVISLSISIDPVAAKNQINETQSPISTVFTPEVQYWGRKIEAWATAAGLDPNLAATVMQIESCGDPRARSRSGAIGLFQVMPYHFSASDDPYAPDTNALRGLDYLKRSFEAAHGDPRLALAGYNGGVGVIGISESSWATQTQKYAYWGSGIYADASSGASGSPHLQEWLVSNGESLCKQAAKRLGITP